jgi:hypothetical protein
LKPLYSITNKIPIKDPNLRMMSINLALYETMKAYHNSLSMEFSVREVLAPYCKHLRNAMHDRGFSIFLIMYLTINGNPGSVQAEKYSGDLASRALEPLSTALELGPFRGTEGKMSKVQQEAHGSAVARQSSQD